MKIKDAISGYILFAMCSAIQGKLFVFLLGEKIVLKIQIILVFISMEVSLSFVIGLMILISLLTLSKRRRKKKYHLFFPLLMMILTPILENVFILGCKEIGIFNKDIWSHHRILVEIFILLIGLFIGMAFMVSLITESNFKPKRFKNYNN